uniref:Tail fiber assembly protein n=1 Tax=Salmonella phage vB_SEnST11_KE23 TaxID=3161174 RepID=A0AAU8GGE3_9CAUD
MTKVYGEFSLYTPTKTDENAAFLDSGAVFLKDKDGNDWYDIVKELTKLEEGTKFLLLSSNDVVLCVSSDVSAYFPDQMKVAVVDEVPEGIESRLGAVQLISGEFKAYNKEAVAQAEVLLDSEMSWATNQILALEDLISRGPTLDSQKAYLEKLKTYRIDLLAVDPEDAPNIKWPERPAKSKRIL